MHVASQLRTWKFGERVWTVAKNFTFGAVHVGVGLAGISGASVAYYALGTALTQHASPGVPSTLAASKTFTQLLSSHGWHAPGVCWARHAMSDALARKDLGAVRALLPGVSRSVDKFFEWTLLLEDALAVPGQSVDVVDAVITAALEHAGPQDVFWDPKFPDMHDVFRNCCVMDTEAHRHVLFHPKLWTHSTGNASGWVLNAPQKFFDNLVERVVLGDRLAVQQLRALDDTSIPCVREMLMHRVAQSVKPEHIKAAVLAQNYDVPKFLAKVVHEHFCPVRSLELVVTDSAEGTPVQRRKLARGSPELRKWDPQGICFEALAEACSDSRRPEEDFIQLWKITEWGQEVDKGKHSILPVLQLAVDNAYVEFFLSLVKEVYDSGDAQRVSALQQDLCVLLERYWEGVLKLGKNARVWDMAMLVALMNEAGIAKPNALDTLRVAVKEVVVPFVSQAQVLETEEQWQQFWVRVAKSSPCTELAEEVLGYPLLKAVASHRWSDVESILQLPMINQWLDHNAKSKALLQALGVMLGSKAAQHGDDAFKLIKILFPHGLNPLVCLDAVLKAEFVTGGCMKEDLVKYLIAEAAKMGMDVSFNNNEMLWVALQHPTNRYKVLAPLLLSQPEVTNTLKRLTASARHQFRLQERSAAVPGAGPGVPPAAMNLSSSDVQQFSDLMKSQGFLTFGTAFFMSMLSCCTLILAQSARH